MKWWIGVAAGAMIFTGCGQAPQEQGTAPGQRQSEQGSYRSSSQDGGFSGSRGGMRATDASRAEFLNRIRNADPQFKTIERALLNDRNELGIVLSRSVDLDAIPSLMRSLLTQMARQFPGEDQTVIAYTPTDPPMKIGTGRFNARTREMTYTPARKAI